MIDIIDALKALADETRLRILNLIYKDTLCVCHIETILKLSQSNASRHLTKLKHAKLIIGEKHAQWIYYRINEEVLNEHAFIKELLEQELNDNPQYLKDLTRLKQYRELGGSCEQTVMICED